MSYNQIGPLTSCVLKKKKAFSLLHSLFWNKSQMDQIFKCKKEIIKLLEENIKKNFKIYFGESMTKSQRERF